MERVDNGYIHKLFINHFVFRITSYTSTLIRGILNAIPAQELSNQRKIWCVIGMINLYWTQRLVSFFMMITLFNHHVPNHPRRSVHANMKPHVCKVCNASFKRKALVRNHLLVAHGVTLPTSRVKKFDQPDAVRGERISPPALFYQKLPLSAWYRRQ